MPQGIEHHPASQGKPLPCPYCGIEVMLRTDGYGCCRRDGGCVHIVVIEQIGGALRIGFYDSEVKV